MTAEGFRGLPRLDTMHVVPQGITKADVMAAIHNNLDNPFQVLAELLPVESLPLSYHFITDGNRRFGEKEGIGARGGHEAGAKVLAGLMRALSVFAIPKLVVWGASPSNIATRERREVRDLFNIMTRNLRNLLPEVLQRRGRIVVMGEIENLPIGEFPEEVSALQDALKEAQERTAQTDGTGQTVYLAINFNETTEQRRAAKEIARRVKIGEDIDSNEALHAINDPHDLGMRALILRTASTEEQRQRGSGWPYMNGVNGSQMEFVPEELPRLTPLIVAEAIVHYAFVEQKGGGNATQTSERRGQ